MKTKGKKYNISVIGLGYWGPNLARNFYKHDQAIVHSVCYSKEEKCQQIQKDYPTIKIFTHYSEITNKQEIEHLGHKKGSLPVCESYANQMISLPMSAELRY